MDLGAFYRRISAWCLHMAPLTLTGAHVFLWCICSIAKHLVGSVGLYKGSNRLPCGKWPTSASPPMRTVCFSIIIRLHFDWHDTFWSRGTVFGTTQVLVNTDFGNAVCFTDTHTQVHTYSSISRAFSLFPALPQSFSLFPHIPDMESWLQGPLSEETKRAEGQKSKHKRRGQRERGEDEGER